MKKTKSFAEILETAATVNLKSVTGGYGIEWSGTYQQSTQFDDLQICVFGQNEQNFNGGYGGRLQDGNWLCFEQRWEWGGV